MARKRDVAHALRASAHTVSESLPAMSAATMAQQGSGLLSGGTLHHVELGQSVGVAGHMNSTAARPKGVEVETIAGQIGQGRIPDMRGAGRAPGSRWVGWLGARA